MPYAIRPITQYAVINTENNLPIAVCKDKSEATSIINMMASHDTRTLGRTYEFSDWARR